MNKARPPAILIVDDELHAARGLRKRIGSQAEVVVRTPTDLKTADLRQADLILIDFELREEGWEPTDLTEPPNGLALSAVLREQIRSIAGSRATGVALYTGQLDQISGTIPNDVRDFAVARLTNLEWVFEKKDPDTQVTAVSLASAVQRLPRSWPQESSAATSQLHRFLNLPSDAVFFAAASEEIDACHPPIHELSNASHALAVVRWLAHRILPYPAFLVDRIGLAARLRLTPGRLKPLLDGESRFAKALEGVIYEGALASLYGKHWWRAGLDELLFEWSGGTGEVEAVQASIERLAGKKLTFLTDEVVPVIDAEYRADRLAPVESSVRLRPDDWPVFADDAWAEREAVEDDPGLRGLLLAPDSQLLSNA